MEKRTDFPHLRAFAESLHIQTVGAFWGEPWFRPARGDQPAQITYDSRNVESLVHELCHFMLASPEELAARCNYGFDSMPADEAEMAELLCFKLELEVYRRAARPWQMSPDHTDYREALRKREAEQDLAQHPRWTRATSDEARIDALSEALSLDWTPLEVEFSVA